MIRIEVVKDAKQNVEFFLTALTSSNLEKDTITLLNKCLQGELYQYLNPLVTLNLDKIEEDV